MLKQEQILLNKYRTSPQGDGQTGLGVTSITSRFTHYNVLKFDFDYIEHLKSKIFDSICCLLEVSDNTDWKETLYANSWFNVMRKDESMNTHSHGYHKNSFYGFHLTITAHETFTSYYHPVKFQEDSFHVPNKIGYLTLFPNYVPHSVSPNRYETPRITIAGDIYASTWLNAKDMLTYTNKNLIEIGNYDINKL